MNMKKTSTLIVMALFLFSMVPMSFAIYVEGSEDGGSNGSTDMAVTHARAGDVEPTTFRERLVEAINTIQDDFEKIIVITHIGEIRDAFPVRIDIIGTPEGSMISVS